MIGVGLMTEPITISIYCIGGGEWWNIKPILLCGEYATLEMIGLAEIVDDELDALQGG